MDYVVATIKSLASGIIIISDDSSSTSSSSSQSTATTTTTTTNTQKNALISIFALTGICFLLSKLLSFVRLIFSLFIIPGKPLSSFGPPRSWALITGASDGIGKEFALQLSRQNFSLLLLSRTSSKLASLAEEISSMKGGGVSIEIKTFAIDFASASDVEYSRLADLIKDLDISILINNVGLSHSIPVTFAQTPEKEVLDIITINNVATLRVSQLVIPGMISRRRGLILTMGSFGGLLPTPLLATYSGSKAFLQYWSSALGSELERYNITVELVQGYLVTTNMSKIRRSSAMVPTPRAFVKTVLGKIGRTGGAQGFAYSSAPFWSHALPGWAIGTLTGFTGIWLVRWNRGMHEAIRKRALRKAEREAAKKAT